jgi:translin
MVARNAGRQMKGTVMRDSAESLAQIGVAIIERFETTNAARDRALNEGRQITRLSANTIRAIHRAEFVDAQKSLSEARALLQGLIEHLSEHPNLYWQGYVQDATKEFSEACITMAMVRGEKLPSPAELGVEDAPYLNGLAEAASELRREILDNLRAGNSSRASSLLDIMDDVYDLLVSIDFPDGITGGLRRTTDQLRAVLERTRNDLTLTLTQERLQAALRDAERTFLGKSDNRQAANDQVR